MISVISYAVSWAEEQGKLDILINRMLERDHSNQNLHVIAQEILGPDA
jgi:hypothetical protein